MSQHGRTLALAESFTGGKVADAFVAVPGASRVLVGSIVTYSDASKRRLLHLREGTLRTVGAVSEGAATEMAAGARTLFGADVGLATTGIAGPAGATPAKPVGTCVAAAQGPTHALVRQTRVMGDREAVRQGGSLHALQVLADVLRREGIL